MGSLIQYFRRLFSVAALLCLAAPLRAQQRDIPFGTDSHIRYNLHNGKYSVWINGKPVIQDACAWYNEERQPDTLPAARSFTVTPLADELGRGEKFTITSLEDGMEKQQSFYVYQGGSGFYTALSLRGKGAHARSMSPLADALLQLPYEDTVRALKVPYDNDAWVRYAVTDLAATDFTSAEVTAVYNTVSNQGLVIGSVQHADWKTGIALKGAGNRAAQLSVIAGWTDSTGTRDYLPHGIVTVADTLCLSPRILVLPAADWRKGMEQYAVANSLAEPRYIFNWTAAKPFGWNSWGSMQTRLTLDKAKSVVDFFADSCKGFRNADQTLYIDLDSYWDNLHTGGMTGDFSELEAFSRYCKKRGFKPGIYWAPFVDWGKTPRNVEGTHTSYDAAWTRVNGKYRDIDGARAMDPTHPATQKRIAYLINRFKDAGFEMIKIDFLGHAAIEADSFYDPAVHTGMQAFRKGMEFLIDQLDGKMLVYAAISPNLATGRYVHMRRIACDAFKSIDETAYTLNSTSYGWWQNLLYNFSDADHVVFEGATPGANRARLASAIVTGSLITGDDFSINSHGAAAAKELLQNQEVLDAARSTGIFRPVDHHTNDIPSNIFIKTAPGAIYVIVINYAQHAATFQLKGILPAGTPAVKELFSGETSPLQVTLPAGDAGIYRIPNP